MASNIGLGSRFKMLIHIDGLGDAHLSDDDVDISAEFYINGKYNSRSYLVEKSDMTMVESESTYSADCSGAGYKSAGISLSEGASRFKYDRVPQAVPGMLPTDGNRYGAQFGDGT